MKRFLLVLPMLCANPALASDENAFDGPRAELRLGYIDQNSTSIGGVFDWGNAVTVGGELGYDIALGKTVSIGPYLTYDHANSKDPSGPSDTINQHGALRIGGRIGLNLGSSTQLFGKLGYGVNYLSSDTGGTRFKVNAKGLSMGGGLSQRVSGRYYVSAEFGYNRGDFNTIPLSNDSPSYQGVIALGMRF